MKNQTINASSSTVSYKVSKKGEISRLNSVLYVHVKYFQHSGRCQNARVTVVKSPSCVMCYVEHSLNSPNFV